MFLPFANAGQGFPGGASSFGGRGSFPAQGNLESLMPILRSNPQLLQQIMASRGGGGPGQGQPYSGASPIPQGGFRALQPGGFNPMTGGLEGSTGHTTDPLYPGGGGFQSEPAGGPGPMKIPFSPSPAGGPGPMTAPGFGGERTLGSPGDLGLAGGISSGPGGMFFKPRPRMIQPGRGVGIPEPPDPGPENRLQLRPLPQQQSVKPQPQRPITPVAKPVPSPIYQAMPKPKPQQPPTAPAPAQRFAKPRPQPAQSPYRLNISPRQQGPRSGRGAGLTYRGQRFPVR